MGTLSTSTAINQSVTTNRISFRGASRFVAGLVATLVVGIAQAAGSYAYIYAAPPGRMDPAATEFKSLLDGRGYATDLISMADAASTDFSAYRKVLIGDNTGSLSWGTAALTSHINSYGKPIVGIGEGGYAFFGMLGSKLGYPNGWHGPESTWVITNPAHPVFHQPNGIALGVGNTVNVLTAPSNEVGIYAPSFPVGFNGLGSETGSSNHYGLALQNDIDFLWGFSAAPSQFTAVGKDLFINVVAYPTPIPAAAWLLGSGLLGLIGVARRKAV